MYATWFDYGIVTDMGVNLGVIAYGEKNHTGFSWMSAPVSGRRTGANGYWDDGDLYLVNMGGHTVNAYGARPALYQEGTLE